MANDYTYSELMEMQDKAIERVRQMQERARLAVQSDPEADGEEKSQPEEAPLKEEEPENIPKAEIVDNNNNFQNHGSFPFGLNLNLDKDKATILPLLLLLMNEGADRLLLLALVYIMA